MMGGSVVNTQQIVIKYLLNEVVVTDLGFIDVPLDSEDEKTLILKAT